MPVKKYKLFSPTEDGQPRPCAFFLSGNGCRNGENCKFAHTRPESSQNKETVKVENNDVEERSVVSSESGEMMEDDQNPFAVEQSPSQKEKVGSKRKNRRGTSNDPFPKKTPSSSTGESEPRTPNSKTKELAGIDKPHSATSPAKSKKKSNNSNKKPAGGVDFRALDLPVTSFSLASAGDNAKTPESKSAGADAGQTKAKEEPPSFPTPKSTGIGRKWLSAVEKSQADPRFTRYFDFEKCFEEDEDIGGKTAWVKAQKFGDWCKSNPQVVAIDCEMCETEDPVSKKRNYNALCRVSIVDAVTDEVLLNSLVKPEWPVVDYRTFVNGISESHLTDVQFTIRHCQAFMMALCSEETVLIGHAVHHDLKAMRMEHYCVADSSLLFRAADNETATVSLKDLASALLNKDMPKVHDSVNDARSALRCMELYLEKDGNVEPIERKSRSSTEGNKLAAQQLFVHRVPKHVTPKHLSEMFLATTKVACDSVNDIDFAGGQNGKTLITFHSASHANLAFSTLSGDAEEDATGRLQKKVFLRGGKYIRIRKMVHERNKKPAASKASSSS